MFTGRKVNMIQASFLVIKYLIRSLNMWHLKRIRIRDPRLLQPLQLLRSINLPSQQETRECAMVSPKGRGNQKAGTTLKNTDKMQMKILSPGTMAEKYIADINPKLRDDTCGAISLQFSGKTRSDASDRIHMRTSDRILRQQCEVPHETTSHTSKNAVCLTRGFPLIFIYV